MIDKDVEKEKKNLTPPVTNVQKSTSQLGPLKYVISTSIPQLEAGKDFSISVKITNPYSIPIILKQVTQKLPVDLIDTFQKERRKKLEAQLNDILDQNNNTSEISSAFVKALLRASISTVALGASASIAKAVASSVTPDNTNMRKYIDIVNKYKDDKEIKINDFKSRSNLLNKLLDEIEENSEQVGIILQPGDTVTQIFTLKTRSNIFFSPSTYDLHAQVEYSFDGVTHHDTADYKINIKSSLISIILGAGLGSIGGFILRDIFKDNGLMNLISNPTAPSVLQWIIYLLGNILLGIICVVAFARKKETQPIMAIEDFWGGLLIGAIAGYSGSSFLENSLGLSGEKLDK